MDSETKKYMGISIGLLAFILFLAIVIIVIMIIVFVFSVEEKQPPSCTLTSSPSNSIIDVVDPASVLGFDTSSWFILKTGKLQTTDISRCLSGEDPSCYGQNPSTPYTTTNFLYPILSSFVGLPISVQLIISSFTLLESELFIMYGYTPPHCKYWGFTLYLLNDSALCDNSTLFATVADTVNNVNSDLSYSQPWVLICGSNIQLIDDFKKSVSREFKPLVMEFPSFGDTGKLTILGRTALFESNESESYYDNTNTYCTIIKYKGIVNPSCNVKEPIFIPRNTFFDEKTEAPTTPVFNREANIFLDSVLNALPKTYKYVFDIPVNPFLESINYDNGFDCIDNCVNCNGDNRDTVYSVANIPYLIQPNQDIVAIFGVNHSVYEKSLYTNISIYNEENDTGLKSFDYTADDPSTYQVIVIPNPPGDRLPHPVSVQTYVLPQDVTKLIIAERAYIQTIGPNGYDSSGISAAPETLIMPKVWVISTMQYPQTYVATTSTIIV